MSLAANVCLLLSEWISFLLAAVPPRSRRTFVELLIGCMLNPEGWVTRAIGRHSPRGALDHLLQAHRAGTYAGRRPVDPFAATGATGMPGRTGESDHRRHAGCALREDRPGISIKHDHSRKANRPTFLNSQCWVMLALGRAGRMGSALTVPIRSWLVEESGQRGKLWVARQLIDSVGGIIYAPCYRSFIRGISTYLRASNRHSANRGRMSPGLAWCGSTAGSQDSGTGP